MKLPRIDTTRDVRWMSELSKNGSICYIDRSLPHFIVNNRKILNIHGPLLAHEMAEYSDMKVHRSDALKSVYLDAHKHAGIPAEKKWIKDNGFDWNSWEAWCRGKLASLEKKKIVRPPPNTDVRQVPHSRGDLEFVESKDKTTLRATGGRINFADGGDPEGIAPEVDPGQDYNIGLPDHPAYKLPGEHHPSAMDRLLGRGVERYQTFPEVALRGAGSALNRGIDLATGFVGGIPDMVAGLPHMAKRVATAPRDAFTGELQVNDPETGMPTPEVMSRANEFSGAIMGTAFPFAEKGALGIAGGRLGRGEIPHDITERTATEGLSGRGEFPRGERQLEAPSSAPKEISTDYTTPLEGLPTKVNVPGHGKIDVGPHPTARRIAQEYMDEAGLPYEPVKTYAKVDEPRARRIAQAFEDMPHDFENPEARASYEAMADETMAQWQHIKRSGLKVDFITDGAPDPYEASPRLAVEDIKKNNHMWVFPTDSGYGEKGITAAEEAQNPMLRRTGEDISGKDARINDIFRIVHDYFGHAKEGVGFRDIGEENAWRSHAAMYSPLARKAMTTETRGQNSWLNYGPHGEKNRSAKTADTVFADQKFGLLPDWVMEEGRLDPAKVGSPAVLRKSPMEPTVADPKQIAFPGIYKHPEELISDLRAQAAPEDPALKRLFGVTRDDLYQIGKERVGLLTPKVDWKKNPSGALAAKNIQTTKNEERILNALRMAETSVPDLVKGADAWYVMDPAYQRLKQITDNPQKAYNNINTFTGMASPGSEVETEFNRGTAANYFHTQGNIDPFIQWGGLPYKTANKRIPGDLVDVMGHPYHSTAQAPNMRQFSKTGDYIYKKPKVGSYILASGVPETEFQTEYPVLDSHVSRGAGLADTRTDKGFARSANLAETQTMIPWWREAIAEPLGVRSVPAQARQWTVFGPQTGVESALGAPKLEIFAKMIMKTAHKLGLAPEQVRDMVLKGEEYVRKASGGRISKVKLEPIYHDDFFVKRASGGRVLAHYINHSPSEAQKQAGNYKKFHTRVHGLDISIENAKGSKRSGVDSNGKAWECELPAHYGDIKGTSGADHDNVDCYLGPHHASKKVFVVDQKDADTGKFDESKAFLCFGNENQVKSTFVKAFSDGKGKKRLGHITEMNVDNFKKWLKDGNTKKPINSQTLNANA